MGEISDRITKGTTPTTVGHQFYDQGINFIKIESITENGDLMPNKFAHISDKCHEDLNRSQLKENDLIFSIAGAFGRVAIIPNSVLPANTNQALAIISLKNEVYPEFILNYLKSDSILDEITRLKVGVAQYNISLQQVSKLKIPIPSLEIQKQLVAGVEKEHEIIKANKQLIEIYGQKIKDTLAGI